jgi:RHS repeat-associated protein
VSQTGTSTTWIYPFKWYSVASSTGSGAQFATTTDYVFNGDTLVATIDQETASGNATGTPKTRYIHPDHLFYPYGASRISVATSTNERRQFIGQFTDDSALSYLNARFYDSSRGQFLSEDPTFLAVGNQTHLQQLSQDQLKLLSDPQQLNAYGYGRDNPITNKDPQGLWALRLGVSGTIPLWGLTGEIGVQADLQGVEYYYGAGLAGGGGFSLGPQLTTADLSRQYSISTAAFAQGGAGASVEVSNGMTYFPYSNRKPEPYQEASIGFPAAELTGGGIAEVSGPIPYLTWSSRPPINYSLTRPQMVQAINMPTTAGASFNQGMSVMRSGSRSSGGVSTSFSQVVSQLQSALQQLSAILSTYKSPAASK